MSDPYPFHYDMPSVRICDSEIAIQKACRNMIARVFPRTRVASALNGARLVTHAARAKAKAEGMSAGFPDLIIVGGLQRLYPAPLVAFCEIKAKATMSPEQKDWLMFLMDSGHFCGVFRSQETLMFKMREWGFR